MARRPGPDLGERDALAVRPALEQDRQAVHRAPDGGPGPVAGLAGLPGPPGRRARQRDARRERRVLPAGRERCPVLAPVAGGPRAAVAAAVDAVAAAPGGERRAAVQAVHRGGSDLPSRALGVTARAAAAAGCAVPS